MVFTDTHCHLYAEEFSGDIDEVIHKANNCGVKKFYLPAIDSSAHAAMLELEKRYPGACFAMMGLHPCYVKENYKEELSIAGQWLSQRSFAAIGEIGLDFYWDNTFADAQYHAFRTQMQWGLDLGLPIVIHSRNAIQQTINEVKPFADKGLRGIFHCFSGEYANALDIINMGFLLGIGGVVTYKNSGLAEVIEKVSLAHIVLETDAPYLAPVPYRGKRNESSYLEWVAKKIAEVKNCSVQEVAAATTENAEKIFGK